MYENRNHSSQPSILHDAILDDLIKFWFTHIQIYFILVRSVIEYSATIVPAICKTNFKHIQVIQNNALRITCEKN